MQIGRDCGSSLNPIRLSGDLPAPIGWLIGQPRDPPTCSKLTVNCCLNDDGHKNVSPKVKRTDRSLQISHANGVEGIVFVEGRKRRLIEGRERNRIDLKAGTGQ